MHNIQEEITKLQNDIDTALNYFEKNDLSSLSYTQGIVFMECIYSDYCMQYFPDENDYLSYIEDMIADIEDEDQKEEEMDLYTERKEVAYIAWGENQEIDQCTHFNCKEDMEEAENAVSNIMYIKDKYNFELSDIEIDNLVEKYTEVMAKDNYEELNKEIATKEPVAKRKMKI